MQKKNRKGRAAAATAKMTFSGDAGLLPALLQLQPFPQNSGIAHSSLDPKAGVRAAPSHCALVPIPFGCAFGRGPSAHGSAPGGCAALPVQPPAAGGLCSESCSRGCLLRGCSASSAFVHVRDREASWHQSAPVHGSVCGTEPQVPWSVRICISSGGFLHTHPTLQLAHRSIEKHISLISGSSTELSFFWLFPCRNCLMCFCSICSGGC